MRLVADALYASNIATGIDEGWIKPDIVMGYVYRGGGHIWSQTDWNLSQFDNCIKATISTAATYAADVWDAETGDGQPSDIVTFRTTCTNAGMIWCTVYAGKNQWLPEILSIIASEQFSHILIWDSDATGVPHLNNGSTATQYAVDTQLQTGYDLSYAVDAPYWYGIDAQPIDPTPEDKVLFKFTYGKPEAQFVSDGLHFQWVLNASALAVYNNLFKVTDLGITPVNGLAGFGIPTDPTTAKMAGVPWPPTTPLP